LPGETSRDKPIVVVGAGSTGSSTAYHLAKAGRQRVVLIDKDQIAGGTTSKSSAIVRTHYSNEIVARMAVYSRDVLRDFSSIGESGFTQSGLLILAPKELRDAVTANVEMLNRIGARNEVLDNREATRMFPEIDYEDCDLIVFEPESGYADPVGVASSYARAAERMGVKLILGNQVSHLSASGGTVESVALADGSRIECSRVILCTNVWTNKLLERSGVVDVRRSLPLWTSAHPVVTYNRPAAFQGNRPIIWDYPSRTYYKPEGQSLVFVGTLDSKPDQEEKLPEEAPSDVPFETVNSFTEAMVRRIPAMADGLFRSSFVGLYDVTPDQHPIMDELTELGLAGAFCCVGLSGHGFKLSPALGLMNAEMVLGETGLFGGTSFDRSYFSLSRFTTGMQMKTRYSGLATVA
jgi:glycine/D-amino acid oxidase-like deaminating enzyme